MLATDYEVDVTTDNVVMVHFICIYYMPMWPRYFTYLNQNWVMWPRRHAEDTCLFRSL